MDCGYMGGALRRALTGLSFVAALIGGQALAAERPNILMIVADDHGRDAISAYGARDISTPNIDAIARDGLRFDMAFGAASSCSPSRATILSGLQSHTSGMYGLQHGVNHFEAFDTVRSLPVVLSEAGYRTGRIGKYHVGPRDVFSFGENLSTMEEGDPLSRDPVKMAELSHGFIANKSAPFFLYFATADPHRSGENPLNGPNRFGNGDAGSGKGYGHAFDPAKVTVPSFIADTPEARAEIAQYYQSISRIDEGVGRLIALLKETGQYENTIILYLSDNGMAFPGAKTSLYDPGIHLPLLIHAPAVFKRGGVSQSMVSWVDLAPTLLDLVGVSAKPQKGQGRSFRKIIEKGDDGTWNKIYASQTFHEVQMYYPMRVVRTRDYKFIWNIASPLDFPFALDLYSSFTWQGFLHSGQKTYGDRTVDAFIHRPAFELYDLRADPGETRNLADDPAYAEKVAAFKADLKAYQIETNDRWARKWDYE